MNAILSSKDESKLLKLALNDKRIAVAVLGQALLDEGGIGAQSITIFYNNEGEAEQLWEIANSLGYANKLRKKKHRNHFHFGFSIKASIRKELYEQIGPLPNSTKDRVFQHLANRQAGTKFSKGETEARIIRLLEVKPKTVLQLMLDLNTGASTTRRHLAKLQCREIVTIVGKDKGALQKSLRTANLWGLNKSKKIA